jgi:hypothetical protein
VAPGFAPQESNGSATIQLRAGDYVELTVNHHATPDLQVDGGRSTTVWSGYRVTEY